MRTKHPIPVAILCADIHLSLRPPLARAEEPDWFAAMARPLKQIEALVEQYRVPVLCAGDVFHHWRSPPELINFALNSLPNMYAIPGQHDMPYHSMEEMRKSAYWTLVKTGKITSVRTIDPDQSACQSLGLIDVFGFPFGVDVAPPPEWIKKPKVALIHRYIWIDGCSYPGAPDEARAPRNAKEFKGYDVVVTGDNHKGFLTKVGTTTVFNCGGLMRRTSDEIDRKPMVGILWSDGHVEPHYLDTSEEKMSRDCPVVNEREAPDLDSLFDELGGLQGAIPDFEDVVKRALDRTKATAGVRRAVLEAMDHDNG